MRHWVVIDTNNKFIPTNYKVEGNVLRKMGRYSSCQILGKDPFPPSGRHFFSLYLDNISWSVFSVGVGNQNRRNYQNSHESSECISLFGKLGTVWQDGVSRGGGSPIPDRVELRVVVDFLKGLVKWFQEGIEIASTSLGSPLA